MWRALFPVLAFVLFAAHVLFHGWGLAGAAAALVPILFFFVRRPASRIVLVVLLAAAGLEWVRTTYALVEVRMALGRDWTTAAVILLGCALFSWLSGWMLFHRPVRRWFGEKEESEQS